MPSGSRASLSSGRECDSVGTTFSPAALLSEKAYLNFFSGVAVELVPFDLDAAKRYGKIRSRERVRPADAIQFACAAAAGTDLFVTNDTRLSKLVVSGVTFITGVDRIPY